MIFQTFCQTFFFLSFWKLTIPLVYSLVYPLVYWNFPSDDKYKAFLTNIAISHKSVNRWNQFKNQSTTIKMNKHRFAIWIRIDLWYFKVLILSYIDLIVKNQNIKGLHHPVCKIRDKYLLKTYHCLLKLSITFKVLLQLITI